MGWVSFTNWYKFYDIATVLLISLIKTIILFLTLTIVIATVTLIERKVLALVQRRVGPNYVGYKGRLQFIADAVKLLVKHITVLPRVNRTLFLIVPALVLITSYLFWANLIWGPNLAVCEIEYNLFFMGVISTMFSYYLVLVGFLTNSKYAILSSARVIIMNVNLELMLNFFMICLTIMIECLNFAQAAALETDKKWHIFLFFTVLPVIFITFFLETGRIPYDLAEAESELVAGYTTEYGGFFFALFYLGEYFHLYCFSGIYAVALFGAWCV